MHKFSKVKMKKGFTLLELLLSAVVLISILLIILPNYGKFSDNLALGAATQEIAIAVRQAQVYGSSVKEADVGGNNFTSAYGVYIDPRNDPSNIYIFTDKDNDKIYDVGTGSCGAATTECVEKVSLLNNVKISRVCDASMSSCYASATTTTGIVIRKMNTTFTRPTTNAKIDFLDSSDALASSNKDFGTIVVYSPRGKYAYIVVEKTGQVTIK